MTTFTALTTVDGKEAAYALSEAMERMDPEPLGVGVFELEDGSGLWEIGGVFYQKTRFGRPDAVVRCLWCRRICHIRSARD